MTEKRCNNNEIYSMRVYNMFITVVCIFVHVACGLTRVDRFVTFESQVSVKYTNVIGSFDWSTTHCLVRCALTGGCMSVNTNTAIPRCEFSTNNTYADPPSPSTQPGWEVHSLQPVRFSAAWQTSTHIYHGVTLKAEFAIDGDIQNTDVYRCAHTLNSYSNWAAEMSAPRLVSSVVVYLWNSVHASRNRNFEFIVSSTRADSDNNIGTMCGTYEGPPSDISQPIQVTCDEPIVGRFLRINHQYDNNLCLCEVLVF